MSDRTGVYTSERGDAIQCRSGRPWHVLDPRPEDVRLGDVTQSLARKGRYACHSARHLSVLEHEVRCCDLSLHMSGMDFSWLQCLVASGQGLLTDESRTEAWVALLCLCHDSAEAYVEDLPRPLKVNLPDYRLIEVMNDRACWLALVGQIPQAEDLQRVKRVDNLMLAAERAQVMLSEADGGLPWGDLPEWPRCAATDLSVPCWFLDDVSDADHEVMEQTQGVVRQLESDAADLLRETAGNASPAQILVCAAKAQEIWSARSEVWESQLRLAWLRRYRLLCGLLGVRECPE